MMIHTYSFLVIERQRWLSYQYSIYAPTDKKFFLYTKTTEFQGKDINLKIVKANHLLVLQIIIMIKPYIFFPSGLYFNQSFHQKGREELEVSVSLIKKYISYVWSEIIISYLQPLHVKFDVHEAINLIVDDTNIDRSLIPLIFYCRNLMLYFNKFKICHVFR